MSFWIQQPPMQSTSSHLYLLSQLSVWYYERIMYDLCLPIYETEHNYGNSEIGRQTIYIIVED